MLTLEEYLINPMGKDASVMMIRDLKPKLDEAYSNLHSRIRGSYYIYQKKYLIAHIRIPSGSVAELYYDVIIQINIDDIRDKKINDLQFRVFSNCPSFVFTYAKLFNDKKLLCTWTTDKYNPEVLRKAPVIRNPYDLISYEKSLYLTIKYLLNGGRNNIEILKSVATEIDNYTPILNNITKADDVLTKYARIKKAKKLQENKLKELKESKSKENNPHRKKSHSSISKTKTTNIIQNKTAKTKKI